jgi:hypothetical protein
MNAVLTWRRYLSLPRPRNSLALVPSVGGAEDPRHVARGEPFDVPEHDRGSLLVRQPRESGLDEPPLLGHRHDTLYLLRSDPGPDELRFPDLVQ